MTSQELHRQLESLVDQHGLRLVCEHLAEVAWDKAEHLQVNWQDLAASMLWQGAATKLGNVVHSDMVWPS
jgi:hypothetical protein